MPQFLLIILKIPLNAVVPLFRAIVPLLPVLFQTTAGLARVLVVPDLLQVLIVAEVPAQFIVRLQQMLYLLILRILYLTRQRFAITLIIIWIVAHKCADPYWDRTVSVYHNVQAIEV